VKGDLFVWITLSAIFFYVADIEKDLREIIKLQKTEIVKNMEQYK